MNLKPNIIRYLLKQTCATICCVNDDNNPYCFSCFYVFNAVDGLMYFKSSANTHHAGLLSAKSFVSGTVLPDTLNKLIVKGVQFQGEVVYANDTLAKNAASIYHAKMPMAMAMKGDVFTIRIDSIKMTDSGRLLGSKQHWQREIALLEIRGGN